MGAHLPINVVARSVYNTRELQLIRRNYAKHATDDEFNSFIYLCRHLGLCPLKRQIYFFVFNREDADKRSWAVVVGITGFRAIAKRSGRYRPDDEEPKFRIDKKRIGDTNPLGIVSVKVKLFVQDDAGAWFPVTGTARWDEYVPLKTTWSEDPQTGRYMPVGKHLDKDSMWRKMPTRMLEKVAEAHALRKAFPDELSNVYEEGEIDRAKVVDLLPSEWTAQAEAEDRLKRMGGPSVQVDWLDDEPALANVPVGSFADKAMDWIDKNKAKPHLIQRFAERNRHALRAFWGHHPGDALAVKKRIEMITRPH